MAATLFQFRVATNEEATTCCNCGVEFASPILFQRHRDGEMFYCPNGHGQHYIKTTEQRLREELEAERRKRENAESDAQWHKSQAKGAAIQAGKARAALQRIEKRINAGVCPECHRTFKQLASHMKCKHPDKV